MNKGEAPLCKCGCGRKVNWSKQHKKWNAFIHGHYPKWKNKKIADAEKDRKSKVVLPEWARNSDIMERSIFYRKQEDRFIHVRSDGSLYSDIRDMMSDAWHTYMKSEEWKIVKEYVIKRDKSRCVDCGIVLKKGDGGAIHHEHYNNFGMGNFEEASSCVYLCRKCHSKRHLNMSWKEVPFFAKQSYDRYYPSRCSMSYAANQVFNNL